MKTVVPAKTENAQRSAEVSKETPHFANPQTGRLAQLAAMMNQGPRVQAQLGLAEEIQNSERVQNQLGLAVEINHAPAAQLWSMDDDDPAQRETHSSAPAQLEESTAPNRTGLPDQLKAGVENLSGISLDDVKVHYNSAKPAQLNALAYAQGTDIHVAPEQEEHLPHEAWHIVQQKQGRVQPTVQMKAGVPVNDDPALEDEADTMGAKAGALRHFSGADIGLSRNDREEGSPLQTLSNPTAQMKAGHLSTAAALEQQAGRGITLLSETRTYESVLDEVDNYHNNATTPANDFGKQLYQLTLIAPRIAAWEAKYGPTSQPVVNRTLLGLSRTDQRRQVLNTVKNQLPVEEQAVMQQGLVQANANHLADRARLLLYVQQGLQQNGDRLLQNSCDWILNAGKTLLYAATPTGDSFMRLRTGGKNPVIDEAFFPEGELNAPGDIRSPAVSYNPADFSDNTNVTLRHTKRTGGWNDPGAPGIVVIVRPATKTQSAVWQALRHEVQHDADKHKNRESLAGLRQAGEAFDAVGIHYADITAATDPDAGVRNAALLRIRGAFPSMPATVAGIRDAQTAMQAGLAEIKLAHYKTEYRAYSYQESNAGGPYTALDNTVQNQNHMGYMFTARQLAIFQHIYAGYSHTKTGWDDNPLLADGVTRFRAAVAAYWDPDTEGFNKYNSARVDDFYRALDGVGVLRARTQLEVGQGFNAATVLVPEHDENDGQVQALLVTVAALTHDDAQYILNESPAMLAKINSHLGGQARTHVIQQLNLR